MIPRKRQKPSFKNEGFLGLLGTVPIYGEEEIGMRRGTHVSGSGTVPRKNGNKFKLT
jgi:hypothetical protein